MTPRDLALAALNSTDDSPGFQERYLEAAFERNGAFDERDRAFVVHLVQGVLRWQLRLDWIIRQTVRFPFKKIEPTTLNILRLALYQIFFMDRVPERAAVNEAVRQAGGAGHRHVTGFVNGILRHICRHKGDVRFPDPGRERDRYLSLSYSYPLWLVKKWIREMGSDAAERLLDAGNRIPVRVIRVNTLKTDIPGLIGQLNKEGVTASTCAFSPEGLLLEDYKGPVDRLEAFGKGLFQVQGEAAQICAHVLGPRHGEAVLDVCAGLGGKSTHLAALMKDGGIVLALDRSRTRLVGLSQNAKRLGVGSLLPVAGDAAGPLSSLMRMSFDRILVDGPCSGLGVISRHPDAKLTKREADIERLARLQATILNQAVSLLRKGGRLLYVTCTISKEENEGVVHRFLKRNRDMAHEDLRRAVPEWVLDLIDENGFFKTLPHVHSMEGFFAASFTKM
ncbi:MAG: 16S rRNA (cytosine(967)-C(5))-methyltransferase RsmB [Deltaproteobacteria bacterium]|nr:16S rRNA (cytosine(967)-C(5))-methyltransferase RsmB [Deltaproteobacteria bacterium]